MVSHTGDPVNIHTTNDQKTGTVDGQFVDIVGPRKVIPGTTFNEHSRQTFKATYKGKSYKLSTVVHRHVQVQNGKLVHRDATVITP